MEAEPMYNDNENNGEDYSPGAEDEVQELDNISSIALLIDDLSHEDPSIKINALSKLTNISQLIGETRTRDELIPLLSDMIDKIDENSELMIVLAEQLGFLISLIGPQENFPLLLKPLEMIANNDEAVVRDKAVESFCKIASNMSKDQHTNEFLPLVKRLSKGDTYMMKISATGLFVSLYPNVSAANQTILRQFFLDLCKDDMPMVRRAAATSMGKFSQVVDPYFVKTEFVKVLQELMGDPQDAVKVASVECAARLIQLLKNDEVSLALLPALRKTGEDKTSWRLRFALAESTTPLLGLVPSSAIDEYVVNWIALLLADVEAEVRSQAVLEL